MDRDVLVRVGDTLCEFGGVLHDVKSNEEMRGLLIVGL